MAHDGVGISRAVTKDATLENPRVGGERGERCSLGRHAPAEGGERRTRRSPPPAGARGCSDTPQPTPTTGAAKGEAKRRRRNGGASVRARAGRAGLALGRRAPTAPRVARGGMFTLPPPQGGITKRTKTWNTKYKRT